MKELDDTKGKAILLQTIKEMDAKIVELETELNRLKNNMPWFITHSTFLNPPQDIKKS